MIKNKNCKLSYPLIVALTLFLSLNHLSLASTTPGREDCYGVENDTIYKIEHTPSILQNGKRSSILSENTIAPEDLPLIASFNSGGPAVNINGINFMEDAYSTNSNKTGGTTFDEITGTDLEEVYKTERSSNADGSAFSYNFPVTNGTYKVKLHFAELWFGAPDSGPAGEGNRIFNVAFEGETLENDLDIVAEVGAGAALERMYEVNVEDGTLNIDFTAAANRPQVCAIQLYGTGTLREEAIDSCSWTEVATTSIDKMESQSAKIDDKLYTFSGFTHGFEITALTEIYDTTNDIWYKGAPMPTPVTHMGIAVINNDDVWIIGGFTGNDPGVATDIVQIYNASSDTWREGPSLPARRGSGAAAVADGKIHYFGGLLPDRLTDTDDHYVLDTNNMAAGWVEAAPLPYGRNHLSAATVDGLIYAIGGQYGHDNLSALEYLRYLHVYDPATDSWSRKADLPSDRSHFEPGTIVHNNKIVIVGGRRGWFFFDDITEYDPDTNTWTEKCKLPEPLLAPSAKIFNDRLYVANGGNGEIDLRNNTRWMGVEPDKNLSTEDVNPNNAKDLANAIIAYPNPAHDTFTLSGLDKIKTDIVVKINAISGATLVEERIKASAVNNDYTINISALQTGIYFVEINTESNIRKVIKFIKN